LGTITFISPEIYPQALWMGKVLRIQEALKIVGYAEVTKIINELLRKQD